MSGVLRRHALQLLVGLNVVLLSILLALWVTPSGALRGAAWTGPAPHLTDFASQLPTLPSPTTADIASFTSLLEKPLFSSTRRPPTALTKEAPAAKVDNLSTAKLTGIFNSGGTSGIIIRMAGKDRRVQLNETFDGWTLKSVSGRQATFASGDQTRVLELLRADMAQVPASAPVPAGPTPRPKDGVPSLSPFLPAPSSGAQSPMAAPNAHAPSVGARAPDQVAADKTGAAVDTPIAPKAARAVFGGSRP